MRISQLRQTGEMRGFTPQHNGRARDILRDLVSRARKRTFSSSSENGLCADLPDEEPRFIILGADQQRVPRLSRYKDFWGVPVLP